MDGQNGRDGLAGAMGAPGLQGDFSTSINEIGRFIKNELIDCYEKAIFL